MLDYSQLGIRRIDALEWARAGGVTFLLQDDFTTADAAPISSPRTCEPGPGTLTAVETSGTLAISGGVLDFNGSSTTWFELGLYSSSSYSRSAGLMFRSIYNFDGFASYPYMPGLSSDVPPSAGGRICGFIAYAGSNVTIQIDDASSNASSVFSLSTGTDYESIVMLRGSGAFFFLKGGTLSEYTLLWVSNTSTTTPIYWSSQYRGLSGSLDSLRVARLAAPWNTDNGIATDSNTGNVPVSTTMTHEADSLFEFTVTTMPSAGNIDRFFRIQDASNYWIARVTNGGTLDLIEVVAGGETSRGSGGTVTNGERIVIVADDDDISGYADNVKAWTYASASNFKTETAGELDSLGTGGAVEDDIVWPRTLSGSALTELEKYTA